MKIEEAIVYLLATSGHGKKKLGLALIILLILGVTAVVTCPDKEAHKDAITKVINEVVQEELGGLRACFHRSSPCRLDSQNTYIGHYLSRRGAPSNADINYN